MVDNNLILDCDQPIWMTDIGADLLPTLEQLLAQMPYEQPPWSARYPALLTIESDGPTVMKYNTVIRTVTAGSGPSAYSADALQYGTLEDNWTSDSGDVGLLDIGGGCYYPRAGSPIFAHVPDFEILPAGLVGPFADRGRVRSTRRGGRGLHQRR